MRRPELTFDAVDDLVGAHSRGKLNCSGLDISFSPSRLGPLVELGMASSTGRHGPLLRGPLLDSSTHADLRAALAGTQDVWFDHDRRRGLMRTVFDPLNPNHDVTRVAFFMSVRVAAGAIGFPAAVAQSLAAAIKEMESNVHEHSANACTGLLAYYAAPTHFEFVATDSGVGILETLRQAPEFRSLTDHGRAMHAALQEGNSKFGRAANRGNGFHDLFIGLANLNADLRFRSGDHALTISGANPDLKKARLDQKAFFQGFLVSVLCRVTPPSLVTH